jgi:hypothetical protein
MPRPAEEIRAEAENEIRAAMARPQSPVLFTIGQGGEVVNIQVAGQAVRPVPTVIDGRIGGDAA